MAFVIPNRYVQPSQRLGFKFETELLEKTRSRSRPEMGSFKSIIQVYNQDGVMVMSFRSIGLIQVRGDQDLQA